jgi:hypothetical protein
MTAIAESPAPAVTPLTDWIASSDREPGSGELLYECVAGNRTFLCERSDDEDGDGPFWESNGFYVSGVTKWRVITGRLDHQTKLEWAAYSQFDSDPS